MTNEIPTKEKFLQDLHDEFPLLKKFREHELKKTAHGIFNKSSLGRVSSIIYLIIAFSSILVYWRVFDINIILSVFLGIVTWFVVTFIFDKIFIKFLGIEQAVKRASEENIKETTEKLRKYGLFK